MKKIPLTQGKFAVVDDEDFSFLIQWKWHFGNGGYAIRADYSSGQRVWFRMHRLLIETPSHLMTDHINGNKLDNRKINLRICTNAQNMRNTGLKTNNTSGHKGVSYDKERQKWSSQITFNYKLYHLGRFLTKEEAIIAYNMKAKDLFGEFAYINKK